MKSRFDFDDFAPFFGCILIVLMVVGYGTILALHVLGTINLYKWPWWALVMLAFPGPVLAFPQLMLNFLAFVLLIFGVALERIRRFWG